MIEVWKSVVGYEDFYEVSNRGRVWGCRRNHEMKRRPNNVSDGYRERYLDTTQRMELSLCQLIYS